jgi:EAL domain-containing protein (putative c-di-GMP-specific phosphodiesterase class I)
MGVRVSIDDFGTGYSSLSYLKRFPVDTVKIDRSFVMDIDEDPDDAAIVAAIIALAGSLTMDTVAEGVETKEQLAFLKERGCSSYQGFLFSRALPAQEFAELMANATPSGSEHSGMMPPVLRQQLALGQ